MGQASLARRLLLAFFACFLALAASLILLLTVLYDTRYVAAENLAGAVASELRAESSWRLALPPGAEALQAGDGVWFLARDERGRILAGGEPPADARRLLGALPRPHFSGEEILNFVAGDGRPATAQWIKSPVGPVTVLAGGAPGGPLGAVEWSAGLAAVTIAALVPLTVLFLILALATLPLVLRALRRLRTAAAAVDGSDLAVRLPEDGVVSELRPVVQAFNAALDRVQGASERRDRLVGDIAHELRTPLAVLTLRLEDLPDGPGKAEFRRGLDRLSQMIAQMLDSERLGALQGQGELVDLVAIARAAVAQIAPLALAEGYDLDFIAEEEPVLVQGDGPAIGRAISNLLGNAVAHAGGTGAIQVRVTADRQVEVEDAGAGLARGAHERVFEPFHRERWDKDGCGLGLHLVRQVMKAHGGRAEAADGDAGALFRLVFPAPA